MASSWQLKVKMKAKHILRPGNETTRIHINMIVWSFSYVTIPLRYGFRYGLTHGIGTLKVMASAGVFVHVVCAFKCSISCDSQTSSTIFT